MTNGKFLRSIKQLCRPKNGDIVTEREFEKAKRRVLFERALLSARSAEPLPPLAERVMG